MLDASSMHSHYLVTWWSPVTVEFQTSNFELVSFGIQTRPYYLVPDYG